VTGFELAMVALVPVVIGAGIVGARWLAGKVLDRIERTEAEADAAHEFVRKRWDRYNGGYMDGMPCGRDSSYDKRNEANEVTAYAVTTR
jgi:hypothetical protein